MTEYTRNPKADECAVEAKELTTTLLKGTPIKIKPGFIELDSIKLSPFQPSVSYIHPPIGTITGGGQTLSGEGAIMASLAAEIIKPYYDTCMNGEPTFLPKKPAAAKGK
jgi:hypothetical protein